jgi:hypothetical protein
MYVVMTTLRSASKSLERRFWTLAVLVTCVSALAYAGLEAAFVFQTPTTGERVVYGFVCTPEARLVYPKKCPWLGPDELRGAEYDTTRLWTKNSIALVTVAIDGSWLAAFIALGALSAGGVLFTRTRSGMGLVRV